MFDKTKDLQEVDKYIASILLGKSKEHVDWLDNKDLKPKIAGWLKRASDAQLSIIVQRMLVNLAEDGGDANINYIEQIVDLTIASAPQRRIIDISLLYTIQRKLLSAGHKSYKKSVKLVPCEYLEQDKYEAYIMEFLVQEDSPKAIHRFFKDYAINLQCVRFNSISQVTSLHMYKDAINILKRDQVLYYEHLADLGQLYNKCEKALNKRKEDLDKREKELDKRKEDLDKREKELDEREEEDSDDDDDSDDSDDDNSKKKNTEPGEQDQTDPANPDDSLEAVQILRLKEGPPLPSKKD